MVVAALKVRVRAIIRLGAFSQACKGGLSVEQARAYADRLYPPSEADLAYEGKQRERHFARQRFRFQTSGSNRWWRLGNPLWDFLHIQQIICSTDVGLWPGIRSSLFILAFVTLSSWF
jgi:hypothetical protein